jgi:hypothetical protein
MARFIKKPVIIEAEQLLLSHLNLEKGVLHKVEFFGKTFNVWFMDADTPYILIPTLEGNMMAKNTDWIIKGIKGELYPCREDIFEMTYDKA